MPSDRDLRACSKCVLVCDFFEKYPLVSVRCSYDDIRVIDNLCFYRVSFLCARLLPIVDQNKSMKSQYSQSYDVYSMYESEKIVYSDEVYASAKF